MQQRFDTIETIETAMGCIFLLSGETCDADEAVRRERLHVVIAQTVLEAKSDAQNPPDSDELVSSDHSR